MNSGDWQPSRELDSFRTIWQGGYYEGDPLDPLSRSSYRALNWISTLHATYLCCIKPYVGPETVALEIGPGRGCWTRSMLGAKKIYALDALSAEHNGIFDYLGNPANVEYHQVADFECKMIDDNEIDFLFSFGCLCHVSFEGISAYAKNLFPKLKSGAQCFWMIADYDKYNSAMQGLSEHHMRVVDSLLPYSRLWYIVRSRIQKGLARVQTPQLDLEETDNTPSAGRWFNSGIKRTTAMLAEVGYEILDEDVGTNLRDPIIHFRKP
jgi:hypothetical protein